MKIVYMKVEMETEPQIMHHLTLFPDIIQSDRLYQDYQSIYMTWSNMLNRFTKIN